jgi:hypothetical protein
MKRMFAMLAVALISLSACEEIQQVVTAGITLLNEEKSAVEFTHDGGRVEVAIAAIEDWTAESDSRWCIVSPANGTNKDTKVVILADKNRKSEDRTAVVTLKTASTTIEINVLQHQKPEPEKEPDEDEEEPENDDQDENFLFMITHEAKNFQMPVISGNFTGLILWGDGKEEEFSPSATGHVYFKADGRIVIMQFDGRSDSFKVEFNSLKDIVKVDLSGL